MKRMGKYLYAMENSDAFVEQLDRAHGKVEMGLCPLTAQVCLSVLAFLLAGVQGNGGYQCQYLRRIGTPSN